MTGLVVKSELWRIVGYSPNEKGIVLTALGHPRVGVLA